MMKKKIKLTLSDPLTVTQRQSGRFLLFIMKVHPDQADTNCRHSHTTCSACVKLTLDADSIDDIINTQIILKKHIIIFHLTDLENGRKPCIGIFNKDREDIFS